MAYDFGPFDKEIKETEDWLQRELSGIRTGRSSPAILDGVRVDSYGARTPLRELGSVTIEDARTLRVVLWDKSLLKAADKAISGLRIFFPELTSDRRVMLMKLANEKVEQAKITLRGHRSETIKYLEESEEDGVSKDEIFRLKEDVQKRVDAGTAALDALAKKKEDEISL
jgi:ribosome recycling factor